MSDDMTFTNELNKDMMADKEESTCIRRNTIIG
jgi:hypothetical protein